LRGVRCVNQCEHNKRTGGANAKNHRGVTLKKRLSKGVSLSEKIKDTLSTKLSGRPRKSSGKGMEPSGLRRGVRLKGAENLLRNSEGPTLSHSHPDKRGVERGGGIERMDKKALSRLEKP